jgi:hypothetical protein
MAPSKNIFDFHGIRVEYDSRSSKGEAWYYKIWKYDLPYNPQDSNRWVSFKKNNPWV